MSTLRRTPNEIINLYSKIREGHDNSFILETREKHNPGFGHTYLGAEPDFIVSVEEAGTYVDGKKVSSERDPFIALSALSNTTSEGEGLTGGFVGYTAYDAIHSLIGGKIDEPSIYGYYSEVLRYDHHTGVLSLVGQKKADSTLSSFRENKSSGLENIALEPSAISSCDADMSEYIDMVGCGKEYVYSGDVFQVVLSREYCIDTDTDPFMFYRQLSDINPSPYLFLMEFEKKTIAGSSPETMASVRKDTLHINPIAGTRPRAATPKEDREIAMELLEDEKERAEHIMLVDLARNDAGKVCIPSTISIPSLMEIHSYSHVHHIESAVEGKLASSCSQYDAIRASFPAGTLSGAPKIRAMEIIDELEKSKRKVYGGCAGYFSTSGDADAAIAIRMAEFEKKVRIRAGAGIVADSDPLSEYNETEKKMGAMLSALCVEGY